MPTTSLTLPQPPDSVFFPEQVTVWRPADSYAVDGAENARLWTTVATAVPLYLQANPSNYELQGFILSEGDNIFTLDIGHFPAPAVAAPGDVLKLTAGPDDLLGGFWMVRGDKQPVVWLAGKVKYVMARLPQAPTGVS